MQTKQAIPYRSVSVLKYTVIKNKKQYNAYCDALEILGDKKLKSKSDVDEMELLQLLIDKYDEAHFLSSHIPPHEILRSLANERNMKGTDLADLLNVSPGLISDMLNGKKAISKSSVRILAEFFKVHPSAFL